MRLIYCFEGKGALSAPECANVFFSHNFRLLALPKMGLQDCNSRLASILWKALWEFLETKILFSSAYHP